MRTRTRWFIAAIVAIVGFLWITEMRAGKEIIGPPLYPPASP